MNKSLTFQAQGTNPQTNAPFSPQNFTVTIAETLLTPNVDGMPSLMIYVSGFDMTLLGIDVPQGQSSQFPFYVAPDCTLEMAVDLASLFLGHLFGDSAYGPFITDGTTTGYPCGFLSDTDFDTKYADCMNDANTFDPIIDGGGSGGSGGTGGPGSPGTP